MTDKQIKLRNDFNNNKTTEEKSNIKILVDKMLKYEEMTKQEYNQLIKYYFDIDMLHELNRDFYKCTDFMKYSNEEKYILDKVIKACFIIGY